MEKASVSHTGVPRGRQVLHSDLNIKNLSHAKADITRSPKQAKGLMLSKKEKN